MSTAAPEKSSILIVDDTEESLIALQAVLGPLNQHLVSAHSGEEALKAMLRREFAVVLLDVLMPGMDGFETAANIKRLDQTKDVPVILLTGVDTEYDYAYRGYALGVADFLTKPVDPWLLRTKVNVFLELHQKNRQLAAQAEQLRRLLVRDREPAEATPPGATDAVPPAVHGREQLTRITERLAQIELMLRESGSDGAAGLADRITDLERGVAALGDADGPR